MEDDDGTGTDGSDGSDMSQDEEIMYEPADGEEEYVSEGDMVAELDEEGEWIDEPEAGEEDGLHLGDMGQEEDGFAGDAQLIVDDEDDDIDGDSEDPDSYTDEEEAFMSGELEFEADMEEEMRQVIPEDPNLRFMSNDARRQRISEPLAALCAPLLR